MNQKEVIYDYLTETLVQHLQEKCMEAYPKLANNGWKIGRSSSIYVKYAMPSEGDVFEPVESG